MRRFTLERLGDTGQATFGQLLDEENTVVCVTLELPWLGNLHNVSCIPAAEYPYHRYMSPKRGYEVVMLDDVPDRSAIELHIGNLPHDTDGCILLGTAFGMVNGQKGITGSKDAFVKFMNLLAGENNGVITVKDPA